MKKINEFKRTKILKDYFNNIKSPAEIAFDEKIAIDKVRLIIDTENLKKKLEKMTALSSLIENKEE